MVYCVDLQSILISETRIQPGIGPLKVWWGNIHASDFLGGAKEQQDFFSLLKWVLKKHPVTYFSESILAE